MPCADERLKPMQGLHGFAAQTRMNADKTFYHVIPSAAEEYAFSVERGQKAYSSAALGMTYLKNGSPPISRIL
jgi:hypothetical protein